MIAKLQRTTNQLVTTLNWRAVNSMGSAEKEESLPQNTFSFRKTALAKTSGSTQKQKEGCNGGMY
jgi:hypothetical protein